MCATLSKIVHHPLSLYMDIVPRGRKKEEIKITKNKKEGRGVKGENKMELFLLDLILTSKTYSNNNSSNNNYYYYNLSPSLSLSLSSSILLCYIMKITRKILIFYNMFAATIICEMIPVIA